MEHGAWGMGHGAVAGGQWSVISDQSVILNFLLVRQAGFQDPIQSVNPSI
jgi:hypothetical protein